MARGHAGPIDEIQAATAVRVVRNYRPIVTATATPNIGQPAIAAAAETRNRKEDGRILTTVGPEIMTESSTVFVPAVGCAVSIDTGSATSILTISGETGKGIRSRHLETNRTRIVNGLDYGVVVPTSCRIIG